MGQYEGRLGSNGTYRIVAQGYSTHFHSAGDLPEMGQIRVVAGDRQAALRAEIEDGAVHDHLAVLVADGAVADLSDLQRRHVVCEQRVGQRKRVRPISCHLRSGDSSQMLHAIRVARCSAAGSPKSAAHAQPSQSVQVAPASR